MIIPDHIMNGIILNISCQFGGETEDDAIRDAVIAGSSETTRIIAEWIKNNAPEAYPGFIETFNLS